MTLRKSSKRKLLFPFVFTNALKSGLLPFIILTVCMLIGFPITNAISLSSETIYEYTDYDPSADSFFDHESSLIMSLTPLGDMASFFLSIGMIGVAILMGICVFKFMVSKKTVNVYYSLGTTRTSMFLARYFAGIILLFIGICVPVLISALLSISYLGYSKFLLPCAFYIILVSFSLAALTFSVTAAVLSCVGTLLEGTVFSAGIMLLPTVIIWTAESMIYTFLHGNPYRIGYFVTPDQNYISLSLLESTAIFNPILYLYYLLSDSHIYEISRYYLSSSIDAEENIFKALEMQPIIPLIWLGVSVVSCIIGARVFNRRKAEICGFFGKSNAQNYVFSFTVGLAAFSFILYNLSNFNKPLSVILGFAAIAFCYIIINIIVNRSFREMIKKLYLLPCQLFTVFAVMMVFVLGFFGYSSRIPNTAEIESVSISTFSNEDILSGDNINNSFYLSDTDEVCAYRYHTDNTLLGEFTSKDDIEKIIQLHRSAMAVSEKEEGTYKTDFIIRYKLYNGKELVRNYERSDLQTIKLSLTLFDSDFYNQKITATYLSQEINGYDFPSFIDRETHTLIAIDGSLRTDAFRYMQVDEEVFNKIKEAVGKDLLSLTSEQYYTPDKPAAGVLVFARNHLLENYEVNASYPSLVHESTLYQNVYTRYTSSDDEQVIFLTEYMKETLKVLEENGLMSYFPSCKAEEIESIAFYPATINRNSNYYSYNGLTLDFRAQNTEAMFHDFYDEESYQFTVKAIYQQNLISDPETIASILPELHLNYYAADRGYVAVIRYKNGEMIEKYITDSDAPDWVKNYEYRYTTSDLISSEE